MLTVAEVAKRCGVSTDAVRRAIARGDLAASKVFNTIRVSEADLEAYIERGRVGGGEVRRRRSPRRTAPARGGLMATIERRAA